MPRRLALVLPAFLLGCRGPVPRDTSGPVVVDTDTADTGEAPTPTLSRVVVYPFAPAVLRGDAVQLRARGVWSDGSTRTLTRGLAWTSFDGAAIDASGLLTAAEVGGGTVRVAVDGLDTETPVHVHPTTARIDDVSVLPADTTVPAGAGLLFSAWATFDDPALDPGDVAGECTWSTDDPDVATAGAAGVVSTHAPGTVTVLASCPDGVVRQGSLTVVAADAPVPAPSLGIASLQATAGLDGVVRYTVTVDNAGGQSPPFTLRLVADASSAPVDAPGDVRVGVPGIGPGASRVVTVSHPYEGPRPAMLSSWASLETDGDADAGDDVAGVPVSVEPAVSSDIAVTGFEAMDHAPETTVVVYLENRGPDDATDFTLYLERDQPGVTHVRDLDPDLAERSHTLPHLAAGEETSHIFDYDAIPWGETWNLCVYVPEGEVEDPDLGNNFSCDAWSL